MYSAFTSAAFPSAACTFCSFLLFTPGPWSRGPWSQTPPTATGRRAAPCAFLCAWRMQQPALSAPLRCQAPLLALGGITCGQLFRARWAVYWCLAQPTLETTCDLQTSAQSFHTIPVMISRSLDSQRSLLQTATWWRRRCNRRSGQLNKPRYG
jgi:hypothetical protein